MIAEVYDTTNTEKVAELLVDEHAALSAKGAERLNRPTEHAVSVAATHPSAGELQHLRVVRVSDGAVALPPFTIRAVKTVEVGSERTVTASGPTLLDRFSSTLIRGSVVDLSLEPQANRRTWNYATRTLPTDGSGPYPVWGGEPFGQDRSETIPPKPLAWPDAYAIWVHPAVPPHATDSWSYWRRWFTLDEDTFVVFTYSADDYLDVAVDGVQVDGIREEFPSEVYKWTYRKHVFLKAGTHLFAARTYNLFASGAFMASAFKTDGVTLGDPIFTTGVLEGNEFIGDWEILYDPPDPPSTTVGHILIEALSDAQNDTSCGPGTPAAGLTCGFTETHDSRNDPWPLIGEFGTDIDSDLGELLDRLSPFADFDMANEGLELLAFDKATGRGGPSGKTFAAGSNLLSLTRTVEI